MLTDTQVLDFLKESNVIENEHSEKALEDAISAWAFVMKRDVLFEKDVLELHQILMQSIRPDIAGKYRTCDVWIGGNLKKYLGLELIQCQISDFINSMISSYTLETTEEKENACKEAHILFESIHPFEDGNGRVGRIIYNWHRLKLGLSLHIIHTGEETKQYMCWFKEI